MAKRSARPQYDDEPAPRGGQRSAQRSPQRRSRDDDYDDDADDDYDDRPRGRGAPSGSRRSGNGSSRSRGRGRDDYDDYDDYDDRPARGRRSSGMKLETKIMIGVGGLIGLTAIILLSVYFAKTGAAEDKRRAIEADNKWVAERIEEGGRIAGALDLPQFATKLLEPSLDAEPEGVFFIKADEAKSGPEAFQSSLRETEEWVEKNILAGIRSKPGVVAVYIARDVKFQKQDKKMPLKKFGDSKGFVDLNNNSGAKKRGEGTKEFGEGNQVSYDVSVNENKTVYYRYVMFYSNKETSNQCEFNVIVKQDFTQ
ncbi:MAG: hypothetical protein ABIH86_00865 [Planctomycetota bacterium]